MENRLNLKALEANTPIMQGRYYLVYDEYGIKIMANDPLNNTPRAFYSWSKEYKAWGCITYIGTLPVVNGKRFKIGVEAKIMHRLRQWPINADITEVEYHRPPTAYELKLGYGATHRRTFTPEECCFKNTRIPKKWFIAPDDGLRYYYSN